MTTKTKLVINKLYGTIIDNNNYCQKDIFETIKKFKKTSIKFALCSGRYAKAILRGLHHWRLNGLADYVCGSVNQNSFKDFIGEYLCI